MDYGIVEAGVDVDNRPLLGLLAHRSSRAPAAANKDIADTSGANVYNKLSRTARFDGIIRYIRFGRGAQI